MRTSMPAAMAAGHPRRVSRPARVRASREEPRLLLRLPRRRPAKFVVAFARRRWRLLSHDRRLERRALYEPRSRDGSTRADPRALLESERAMRRGRAVRARLATRAARDWRPFASAEFIFLNSGALAKEPLRRRERAETIASAPPSAMGGPEADTGHAQPGASASARPSRVIGGLRSRHARGIFGSLARPRGRRSSSGRSARARRASPGGAVVASREEDLSLTRAGETFAGVFGCLRGCIRARGRGSPRCRILTRCSRWSPRSP